MKNLKIYFVDFWNSFQKNNNYFFHLLSTKYNVELCEENPDIVFFSVDYSKQKNILKYKNKKCLKIFFTGENVRPNFFIDEGIDYPNYFISKCDASFSFDYNLINGIKNYRLPLWVIYIDWFNKNGYGDPKYLLSLDKIYNNEFINTAKNKFCCIVASNSTNLRKDFFDKLNKYKNIDGYGSMFNNRIPDGEDSKYKIISNYKFSICFENSISPVNGYYTEKLFHAKTAGNIPIYFSDNLCKYDFNDKCFINFYDYKTPEECIEYIKKIDQDDQLYQNMLSQPLFKDYKIPKQYYPENVLQFIESMI